MSLISSCLNNLNLNINVYHPLASVKTSQFKLSALHLWNSSRLLWLQPMRPDGPKWPKAQAVRVTNQTIRWDEAEWCWLAWSATQQIINGIYFDQVAKRTHFTASSCNWTVSSASCHSVGRWTAAIRRQLLSVLSVQLQPCPAVPDERGLISTYLAVCQTLVPL